MTSTVPYALDSNKFIGQIDEIYHRIEESGLKSDRFIPLQEGRKSPISHSQKSASNIEGNYGVYAGRGLVLVDIDDGSYSHNLPKTLTISSPHEGCHYYYKIKGEISNSVHNWGEVRASKQYVVGPGSTLSFCKNDCCRPQNPGQYSILHNRPIAAISADSLRNKLNLSQTDSADSRSTQSHSDTSESNLEPLPESFDPESQMQHIRGKDTYEERKSRMLDKYWIGKEKFLSLMAGNHIQAGYYRIDKNSGKKAPDRSKGECALANYLGFWFDRNRKIVRYIFETEINHHTKFEENQYHRKNVLEYAEKVDWTYSDRVSLDARIEVAKALQDLYNPSIREITKHPEVTKSKSTVHRAMQYLKKENAVENPERLAAFIEAYEETDGSKIEAIPSFSAIAAD